MPRVCTEAGEGVFASSGVALECGAARAGLVRPLMCVRHGGGDSLAGSPERESSNPRRGLAIIVNGGAGSTLILHVNAKPIQQLIGEHSMCRARKEKN